MPEPIPKNAVLTSGRFEWADVRRIKLSRPNKFGFDSLDHIINRRQTRREFYELLQGDLDALLWYTSRTIVSETDSNGLNVQHRPTPSAGALHPIHLLIHTTENQSFRYIPEEHALALCPSEFIDSTAIRVSADELVPGSRATLLQLIAEPAITHSKYHNADSLVYRDAGVILGYLSIVAEGLALNFCALGLTGDLWLKHSNSDRQLVGVGLAWVGSRLA